jgi:hypothetical protein
MTMRHILLGSTALLGLGLAVAPAPAFAQAEPAMVKPSGALDINLAGFVRFEVNLAEDDFIDRGYAFETDSEFHVNARGSTESGIQYGATIEFEADEFATNNVDETWIFFRGGWGEVRAGDEDGAADNMKVISSSVAAGTGGLDGDLINLGPRIGPTNSGDATKIIYYTPTIAGFQLGASFTPDSGSKGNISPEDNGDVENWFEVGLTWGGDFGGFNILAGAVGSFGSGEDGGGEDVSSYHGGVKVGFGGFNVAGHIGHDDNGQETDYFGIGVGYGFGPLNVSAEYGYSDPDGGDDVSFYVVSADMGIMQGVALRGDVGYVDADATDGVAGVLRVDVAF